MVVMGRRKDGRFYVKQGLRTTFRRRNMIARAERKAVAALARREREKIELIDSMKKASILEIDAKIAKLKAESSEYPFLVPQLAKEIGEMKKLRQRMID